MDAVVPFASIRSCTRVATTLPPRYAPSLILSAAERREELLVAITFVLLAKHAATTYVTTQQDTLAVTAQPSATLEIPRAAPPLSRAEATNAL